MSNVSSDRWAQIGAAFNDVAELPGVEQAARLSVIGSTDPGLRSAVEALLAADAVAGERLQKFDFGIPDLLIAGSHRMRRDPHDVLGLAGRTVAHFRIMDQLASGGMGVVYRAEDIHIGRLVALKFPLPHHHEIDSSARDRFAHEARTAGSLEHSNLCTVYEAGETEQGLYLAMPLYPGVTLKTRLSEEKPFPVDDALWIAEQIANGLACAHAAGIVHRDLKPGNVMILPDGTAKILDFGLAKVVDLTRTKTGATLGTVSYMAPEQVRGSPVDTRADLWSLGILLYEMVTGVRPFSGDNEGAIAHAILHDDPDPPRRLRTGLSGDVQRVILGLLEKEPDSRYANAGGVASDIASVRRGQRPAYKVPFFRLATSWARKRRVSLSLGSFIFLTVVIAAGIPRFSAAINKPTNNPEAYRFFLAGQDYERRGPKATAESLYLKALELDTAFALARARLAVVYAACRAGGSRDCYRSNVQDRRMDRLEQIRTEAERALRQRPHLADAHFALGLYWEQRELPDRALVEFELARKGMRSKGELHAAIGRVYRGQGRWDAAIRQLHRAIDLDASDVTSIADLATTYSRLRRYDESLRQWNRYLAIAPEAYAGWVIKGNVYLRMTGSVDTLAAIFSRLPPEWQKRSVATRVLIARIQGRPRDALVALDDAPRRLSESEQLYHPAVLRAQILRDLGDSSRARLFFDTARVALEKSVRERPDDFRRRLALGHAYAGLGRGIDAKREADRAMAIMPPSRTVPAGTLAMREAAEILAELPEHRIEAVELLDQLMRMPAGREVSVPLLKVDPAWKSLRNDPAFHQLLARYSGT